MTYEELFSALEAEYPNFTFVGDGSAAVDMYNGTRHVTTYVVSTLLGWKTTMLDGSTAIDVAKRDLDAILT